MTRSESTRFLEQEENVQKEVLILVDILANALTGRITSMAFPFGFRTLDQ